MRSKAHLYHLQTRSLSLIEVLISMVLVSILMTTLMGMYAQFEWMHVEVEQARRESFELRYVQGRLAEVLPKAISSANSDHKKDFYFYTSQEESGQLRAPSLVFAYDNGIDLDPLFSNHVLGRLFLEQVGNRKQLVLTTWPIPRCELSEQPPMHKEVLLDDVTDLSFSFFEPYPHVVEKEATGDTKKKQEDRAQPSVNSWQETWLAEYDKLPVLVKVQLKRGVQTGSTPAGEWLDFVYPLPKAAFTIVVDK